MEGWKAGWIGLLFFTILLPALFLSGCWRDAIVGSWVPDTKNPSQFDITFNTDNTATYRIHHFPDLALPITPVVPTPEQEAARKQMALKERQFEAMKWRWSNKGGIYSTWLVSADKPVYCYSIDGRYLVSCDRTGRKLHGRWTKTVEKTPK